MTGSFVHLRLRTEYSLEDSLVRIKSLIKNVVEQNMPAVAVTDFNNFFASVKFYKEAEVAGVKAILGADLRVSNRNDGGEKSHLLLLVQNVIGYKNLTEIISLAYKEGQRHGKPNIQLEWLNGRSINWAHAFAVVDYFADGNFTVHIVNIIDGRTSLWGKEINAKV